MLSRRAFGLGLWVTAAACGDYGPVTLQAMPDGGGLDGLRARNVGEACDEGNRCRSGLVCKDGTCQPGHGLDAGADCTISAECKDNLYCGVERKCIARSASKTDGESCGSEAECGAALRCNAISLSAECHAEGAKDAGAACTRDPDCFGGLSCTGKVCAPPPKTAVGMPVAINAWTGVECKAEPGPVKGHFRVPRGTDDGDFFRLPFPNDVRRTNGRLDLSGFPTPGADVLGYDLVDRWRKYVENVADGFSADPTVVLRFTGPIDLDSLKRDGALRFVDLTAESDVGFGFTGTSARSKYVCENVVTARPAPGLPLEPGHAYAVIVTSVVRTPGGGTVGVADDLKVLLGDTDPGGALSPAWQAYAPLRAWSKDAPYDLGNVVNATVFTVGHARDPLTKLGAQIAAGAAPAAPTWVKCGSGPSPCPDVAGARACGAADPAFDELHALVNLPVYQSGTAPFVADGGDIELDGSGAPKSSATQPVCASLTVPKGSPMPAAGWPVAIYAHDTGGSFRSAIVDGVAKRLASVDAGDARVAVLSFDGVAHATRRGGSNARPEALWFGTQNPGAWRGRNVQAAADIMHLARIAGTVAFDDATSPTGAAFKLGTVIVMGHGQGANAVALAGPHVGAGGMLVAGVGASFVDTVQTKTAPVNFQDVAPVVLGEASPVVLSLFAAGVDVVEPAVHARLATSAPFPKHVFALYGQRDGLTPGPTQAAYTFAAALGIASPPSSVSAPDGIGKPILPVPAGGNLVDGHTAIVRQYAPLAYDGHAVLHRDPDAMRDADRFVADVANEKTPKIGR